MTHFQNLILAGENVLQTDITQKMFSQIIKRSITDKCNLTELKNFNFNNINKDVMAFGGGVLVALDVENKSGKNKLVKDFNKVFPFLGISFQRNDSSNSDQILDQVNKLVGNFIQENKPKECIELPFELKFSSCDMSSAAIVFSYAIFDIPWMYPCVEDDKILFKSSTQKQLEGFKITPVECDVGILNRGIKVTRLQIAEVGKTSQRDDYYLSPKYAYLHIFHHTDDSLDKSILNLYRFVFENKDNIYKESLTRRLITKMATFSMPNVDITASDDIDLSNVRDYGISEGYFTNELKSILNTNNCLNSVKTRSQLKINKDGVAVSSCCLGYACDSFHRNITKIIIDRPFCFAISVGDEILAKGVFIKEA